MDNFIYLDSSISSTENDRSIQLVKAWTAIDRLLIIWKSDLSDKIKCNFFPEAIDSILLYGCTTWTLTKCIEKKLDGNCTRILGAILNKSWKQHLTKQQLYGHLPPISKTIQIWWTWHVGHSWRSKDEPISDILQWTSVHRHATVDQPTRTKVQQICMDPVYFIALLDKLWRTCRYIKI